ncbi:hypothetical protein S245_056350, partial [Arachis hypogaea]
MVLWERSFQVTINILLVRRIRDAGVPGLDDISNEVDIMKEKGKTVDDSIPIDGECNLEIEVFLNSPPTETT